MLFRAPFTKKKGCGAMGASFSLPAAVASTGRPHDRHATMQEFMQDIGVAGQLPLDAPTAAAFACPANCPGAIAAQFRGLRRALALCESEATTMVVVELDAGAAPPVRPAALFAAQVPALRARLTAALRACPQRRLVVALGWQWWGAPTAAAEDRDGGHLTVLVLDGVGRRQYFFNPAAEDPALPFSGWMTGTVLVEEAGDATGAAARPAWTAEAVAARGELTLQAMYDHPTVGCCTTMCVLFLAALWRCGPTDPGAVLEALTVWPFEQGAAKDDALFERMQARLWRWQRAVGAAAEAGDAAALRRLVGLRRRNDGRVCGAFVADGVCAEPVADGWTLCAHHLRAIGLPVPDARAR